MTLKVQCYQVVCSQGAVWTSWFRVRNVNSGLAMTLFQVRAMLHAVLTRLVPLAIALLCFVDSTRAEYRLAAGDVVEFAVTGMPELRTRALIQSDGTISLPIVGTVRVAGLTSAQMRMEVEAICATKKLRRMTTDGREYFVILQPGDVVTTLVEYRPVYVKGDVLNPGQHAYRPLMTVRQAVALSGGFSAVRGTKYGAENDPSDLQRDHKVFSAEFAKEMVRAWRLKAELDEKDEFEPPALQSLPLADPRMAELISLESRLFEIRKRDSRQEETSLRKAIKQTTRQIKELESQEKYLSEGMEADVAELEKIRALFKRNLVTSNRVIQTQRALILSSTRWRQTNVDLIGAKRVQIESEAKLNKISNQRRINLLLEMSESSLKLVDVGSRLQGTVEKLAIASTATSVPSPGGSLGLESTLVQKIEVAIVRKSEGKWNRIPADEDTELEPGDVIEVKLGFDSAVPQG